MWQYSTRRHITKTVKIKLLMAHLCDRANLGWVTVLTKATQSVKGPWGSYPNIQILASYRSPRKYVHVEKNTWFKGRYARAFCSVQSLSQVWLCDPMDCSTSGLPVHHQLPEFTQTHVHWVGDAIQPSHPLSSPSSPSFNFSQHQGLFKWVSSSHHAAKVLEFQC